MTDHLVTSDDPHSLAKLGVEGSAELSREEEEDQRSKEAERAAAEGRLRVGPPKLPTKESYMYVSSDAVLFRFAPDLRTLPLASSILPARPLLHSLAGHTNRAVSLLAHPFLPLLLSGSGDNTVRVWDLDSRSLLRTLAGHTGWVFGLALDPAGRRLASGSVDNTVRLWDLDSGACLRTLAGHSSAVWAVAWEAAGSLIASGSFDKTVRLWHADSGALRHTLEGHSKPVYALAAHPADDLLACGSSDTTVRVWRWSSGECVRTLVGHSGGVMSLAASAAWLVSGSEDKSVRVWSWASGACARVLDGFAGQLYQNSLAWRDSALATLDGGGWDTPAAVRVWDASSADPSAWSCVGSLASKASYYNGVAVVGGGRVACTALGNSTRISVWAAE